MMLVITTMLRSLVPLFGATVVLLAGHVSTVSQEGAVAGCAGLCVAVVVLTIWAAIPYRLAGFRLPWGFIGAFLLALLAGGACMLLSPRPASGILAGAVLLSTAYTVLAVETILIIQQARQRRPPPRPLFR